MVEEVKTSQIGTELNVVSGNEFLEVFDPDQPGVELRVRTNKFAVADHSHAASSITSGIIATARLGAGTPSALNFLRGDGVWVPVTATGTGNDDQTAIEVPFTPQGNLISTDVQAALVELDTEKAPLSHTHLADDVTGLDTRISDIIAQNPYGGDATTEDFTKLSQIDASAVEINRLVGVTSPVQQPIDSKAPNSHTHNMTTLEATPYRLFYSGSDGKVTQLPFGASNTYFRSNGIEAAPSFNVPPEEIAVALFGTNEAVLVGNGVHMIPIPVSLNAKKVLDVRGIVYDQGVTGSTDIQIRRRRNGASVNVLSTPVTISAEYHAADGVIDAANQGLITDDVLLVDITAVHTTTPPNGLSVVITCGI
jgi:hypothetical protein